MYFEIEDLVDEPVYSEESCFIDPCFEWHVWQENMNEGRKMILKERFDKRWTWKHSLCERKGEVIVDNGNY